ncbi:hypothetical protein A9Q86_16545 [Flavobacteriales bacterium 33_180_T64]|nr:hypothetical protein A9Q86_16545 [Flavobacteriales bacterium 33_180_T64]
MKHCSFIFLICFTATNITWSQAIDSTTITLKNGISKPSILSTHPFGIFITRLQSNFKKTASQKTGLSFSIESGNVWSAPVTGYIPNDNDIRDQVSHIEWHKREFAFNINEIDAQRIDIAIDGILKGFRGQLSIPINSKSDLNIGFRSYILTKGKTPFTILTGDQFIESFHDYIAGGEDPFARRVFGFNKAKILYNDRNNNTLEIQNGDFLIGGLETSYYYYPNFLSNPNKNIYSNFGTHIGFNLSKYNSSIDIGFSGNVLKQYHLKDQKYFQIGVGIGLLKKNGIEFSSKNLVFGTNEFIGHIETAIEYNFISKRQTTHSFGIDFYLQTSYNKKSEFNYLIPVRNGVSEKTWANGLQHLYENNNYWTFLYSFTKKVTTTFYVQQDLTLNNNPDIQTGMSISFSL